MKVIVMRNIAVFLIMISSVAMLYSQTASVDKGCVPLEVRFEAPENSSYYWDFDSTGDSEIQKPEHIFSNPGEYLVELFFDNSKAEKIGELAITVYPDLIIELNSDVVEACRDQDITFFSSITKDNEIIIEDYNWVFGDGSSSSDLVPMHDFDEGGCYDISLEVMTNFSECNKTVINPDMVCIEAIDASFRTNRSYICEAPATFLLDNISPVSEDYIYEWDFGNEETFSGYDPESFTYTQEGYYIISLELTTPLGCSDKAKRSVRVGAPAIIISLVDTICPNAPLFVDNLSEGTRHSWDFGSGAEPSMSDAEDPTFIYTTAGEKTVNYSNRQGTCVSDTTFYILVTDSLASFRVTPESICGDDIVFSLEADFQDLDNYYWNGSSSSDGPVLDIEYIPDVKDSFEINRPIAFSNELIINTNEGCIDTSEYLFFAQLPEAFFVPDSIIGFAPLTINFMDLSRSQDSILLRRWDWGDGTEYETLNDLKPVHTFEEPGEYCVQLSIYAENCSDSTTCTIITVLGEDGTIGGGGTSSSDPDSLNIGENISSILCVGDVFEYTVSRTDIHVNTDEQRFDHCWNQLAGQHVFHFPGIFSSDVSVEKNGFQIANYETSDVQIFGARADIQYEKDCENIYEIKLISNCENEASLNWYHGDKLISTSDSLVYQFTQKGEHTIYLEAIPSETDCTVDRDTLVVYVTEPESHFTLPSIMCDNESYTLDASMSIDVKDNCGNNYMWTFEHQRPRHTANEFISHQFVKGRQDVTLTVVDVNGCSASSTSSVSVYGTEVDFEIDDAICLPHSTTIENLTTSDTTIVSWEWNFGSTLDNPSYIFTESDIDTTLYNPNVRAEDEYPKIPVALYTRDQIGCLDTLQKIVRVYEPFAEIILDEEAVCLGQQTIISATDFVEEGKNLMYQWSFDSGGLGSEMINEVSFAEEGAQEIQLIFAEVGTICYDTINTIIDVFPIPNAEFSSSVDSLDLICYPDNIEFFNISEGENLNYKWEFSNGTNSVLTNPVVTFEKGLFSAKLFAISRLGCIDSTTIEFELVGPDGDINIDEDVICLGEEINLSVTNTTSVSELIWDLGDGTVIEQENPITHTYTFRPDDDENTIELILKSAETGCEVIKSVPIEIREIFADFDYYISGLCAGAVNLQNTSIGEGLLTWDFGNGESAEGESTLIYEYVSAGEKLIKLTIQDPLSGCESTSEKLVDVSLEGISNKEMPNVFSPNGDSHNDIFRPPFLVGNEENIGILEFQIYNRWGQLVYNNEEPGGWDGTYMGKLLDPDVYAYYILVQIEGCNSIERKGSITLIR